MLPEAGDLVWLVVGSGFGLKVDERQGKPVHGAKTLVPIDSMI
jgi:hypothetical protein